MTGTTRIAVAQIDVQRGALEQNLRRCTDAILKAGGAGAALVVLPECSLSGYLFDDAGAALQVAIDRDGPEIAQLGRACRETGVLAVIGVLERDAGGLRNAALLIGPDGLIGAYHKAHLPMLGVDRFVRAGEAAEPAVFETPVGRVGLSICYDIRFPESARILALHGADLIAHPANWPVEADLPTASFASVRACENRVVFATANRGDDEHGTAFSGGSRIVDVDGTTLSCARRGQALLLADVDVLAARQKRSVRRPGAFETDFFADRRPDLYRPLLGEGS